MNKHITPIGNTRSIKMATTYKEYVVKPGEHLMAIALAQLGSKVRYTEILGADGKPLADPDKLKPGDVLLIPVGEAAPAPAPAYLSQEAIENAVYYIEGQTFQLAGGRGQATNQGIVTEAWITNSAFGDLNGDGLGDAIVVLTTHEQGVTGHFVRLTAILNRGGHSEHVATETLGDRTPVLGLTIEGGQIVVNLRTHGPDDPMAMPTQEVVWRYRFENGMLLKM
jgi:hypothetical protein